jgi:hypothetical protein
LKEVSADLLQDLNRFIINEKIIESINLANPSPIGWFSCGGV